MMFIINTLALFIAWRLVLYLSYQIYGIRIRERQLIIQCLPLAIITDLFSDIYSLTITGPLVVCLLTFLFVWYNRKNLVETVVVSSTSCCIGFIILVITYHYGNPYNRVGEKLIILAIVALISFLVGRYKLQFTFLRSPKIISRYRKDLIAVGMITHSIIAFAGLLATLLPNDSSFHIITLLVLLNLLMMISNALRLEIII